jgi:hypothetical protein
MLRHTVFLHGSETWTVKAEDKPRVTTERLERILTMVYVVQSYWACPVIETSSF